MAEDAKRQLSLVNEGLHQLEPAIAKRNSAVDRLRQLISQARFQLIDYEQLKEDLRNVLEKLQSEMGLVEKKENDLPSTVASLGLVAYLSSIPAGVNAQNLSVAMDGQQHHPTREYPGSLYEELIAVYSFHDRNRDYCNLASVALNPYIIRKPPKSSDRFRSEARGQVMPENTLDFTRNWFKMVANVFPALSCNFYSIPGTGTVVEITVDRTFRMVMILRGKIIETVNIRGSEEHFNLEPKSLRPVDLWTPSAYETFNVITQNARSAILHFYTPWLLENSLRSYLQWINSLSSLFSLPCKRCGKFLDNFLPPTWRDYRKLEPYHETCRVLTFSSF